MHKLASRWCSVLLLVVAACSSGKDGGDAATFVDAGSITQQNLESGLLGAVCTHALRCGIRSFPDQATCETLLTGLFDTAPALDSPGAFFIAVKAGKVRVDYAKATACADSIVNEPCAPFSKINFPLRSFPGCQDLLSAPLADGATCITDDECATTSYCAVATDSQATCASGTCTQFGIAAGPGKHGGCRDDLDCSSGEVCDSNRCGPPAVPLAGWGQFCGEPGPHCETGLVCLSAGGPDGGLGQMDGSGQDGGSGTAPDGGFGGDGGPALDAGMALDGGTLGPPGQCGVPSTNGGPCGMHGECGPGNVCVRPGVCQPFPTPGAAGEDCAPIGDSAFGVFVSQCASGLVCVPLDNSQRQVCMAPKTAGEACSNSLECGGLIGALICDAAKHVCVQRPSSGPCPAPLESSCSLLTSYCDLSDPQAPVCKPIKKFGESCTSAAQCGFVWGRCQATSKTCAFNTGTLVCMQ